MFRLSPIQSAFRRTRHMAAISTLPLTFAMIGVSSDPAMAENGVGPSALANAIDQKIEQFHSNEDIVGMTVAITKNGRLIYSKGFGQARRTSDLPGFHPMNRDHPTRIGSVSKAVISGPATFKAMRAKGFDPRTKKVYGRNGVLGNAYATHQDVGVRRHQPIIAMAIDSDDKVYTWFKNGKVSVGRSHDLDAHLPPRTFKVADGKRIEDLHAVAISKSNRVYAWYKDGTLSIGQSRDLGYHRQIPVDGDGKPTQYVGMPVGPDGDRKSMLDVVGVAIAESDDEVFVWYDDGTRSSGHSTDFDKHFANRSYTPPVDIAWRYKIRGMAISSNDRVYTWASNGKAFAGDSADLDRHRSPYNYAHGHSGRYKNPYDDITVQHLFDHTAGFARSGDGAAAARTFPYHLDANGQSQYEEIHKHFVATRAFLSKPGTRYSYSNHGMGMTTLLVEALTGKTYREYAVNSYLRPMGLKGKVRAQKATADLQDAFPYERDGNGHDRLPFKASTTGLAAGGWTASAQGILGITTSLADTYDEIDQMAWFGSSGGKLSHNGSTGGGYARVSLLPDDYVSGSGRNLRGMHVATASNTGGLKSGVGGRMEDLMSAIVIAAADANVSSAVNYWDAAL